LHQVHSIAARRKIKFCFCFFFAFHRSKFPYCLLTLLFSGFKLDES
jgi:hypothetical protein